MGQVVNFEELVAIVAERGANQRSLTALAGAPGSGKSTLAGRLADKLNAIEADSAAVFPMDGYHYDDTVLEANGWRPRKGAPHTFDVNGFAHMLSRLATGDQDCAVPVFDRDIEIARAGARIIPATTRHIIVEGNYLLLNESGWSDLAGHFETSVFLDVSMAVLTARLSKRWAWMPSADRQAKLEENDLPNARLVASQSLPAEFVLRNAGAGELVGLT